MRKGMLIGTVAICAALLSVPAGANDDSRRCGDGRAQGHGLDVVGLTADQRLICFGEYKPDRARHIGWIAGLSGDTALVGIDFRPATGDLYGLGNAGGIYTIDTQTAQATFRAQSTVTLSGQFFGVDFNPTVDRLRVVSDTGQNLRINVVDGATAVDASLNYTAGTTAIGIVGAAYTNNDGDSTTATTLFDMDAALDQVVIQAPPNAGSLNPTGKLGLDTTSAAGFDIYSVLRNGRSAANHAFASLTRAEGASFFAVDMLSGQASWRGSFGGDQVIDIALPLNQQ
jgi:hypothetical protein